MWNYLKVSTTQSKYFFLNRCSNSHPSKQKAQPTAATKSSKLLPRIHLIFDGEVAIKREKKKI